MDIVMARVLCLKALIGIKNWTKHDLAVNYVKSCTFNYAVSVSLFQIIYLPHSVTGYFKTEMLNEQN